MKMETQVQSETPTLSEPAHTPSSSSPLVFTGRIFRVRQQNRIDFQDKPRPKKILEATTPMAASEPPRIARMLALAHHMQSLIDSGEVKDRAELARIFGLSRARVTQLLDLTLLAPDIQEAILFIKSHDKSQAATERALRKIAKMAGWKEQRRKRNE